jgi:solute carrier family 25 (peroxisomal adenine nucleotide transporter), member 17
MSAEEPLTPFGNALAGALGGIFSNAVVYPLDTVKTRIQADVGEVAKPGQKAITDKEGKTVMKKGTGMLEGILTIIKSKEGPAGLYRGFGASMVNTFSTQFAYFYWYTVVRTLYINRISRGKVGAPIQQLSTAIELLLGALAGGLAQIFTIPVSVIATRQQLGGPSSKEQTTKPASTPSTSTGKAKDAVVKATGVSDSDSFLGVAREILREDGVTGLWRGLKPSLVLTVNPAITYGVYEREYML